MLNRILRKNRLYITLIILSLTFGCSFVGSVGHHIKGSYYLNEENYDEGVKTFSATLKKNPDEPTANYYMGRYLLALNRPEEALPFLSKAASLEPDKAENQFWLGVAYWSVMDYSKERKCYQKAIDLDVTHVAAHVYLGHNYLDGGSLREALKYYDKALKLDPYQPEALYNRALVLHQLKLYQDETKAWKKYLSYYPDGSLAREAAHNLNLKGDFSYRNHKIGPRLVTLEWIKFKPKSNDISTDAIPSLKVVGSIMETNKKVNIVIESYYKGNNDLARQRAQAIKDYILKKYPEVDAGRLKIKYHDSPERILAGKKIFSLNTSINFNSI